MKVELIRADQPDRRIVVHKLPAILGRDPRADVDLDDSWIGQMQCILDAEGGVLHVLDLGSRLGTFINGHRVQQGMLMPGDRLMVGRTTFLVQYDLEPPRKPLSTESRIIGSRQ